MEGTKVVRFSERWAPVVQEALEEAGRGEQIDWDFGYERDPQKGPQMGIQIWMADVIVGNAIGYFIQVGNPRLLTEELLKQTLAKAVGSLRAERTKRASQNGQH